MTTRTRVKTPGIYDPTLVPSRTLTLMSKASKSVFKLPLPTLWKRITDVKNQTTRAWAAELSDSIHMLIFRARRLKSDELFAAYLSIGSHHSIWLINSGNALRIVPSDSGFQVVQFAWLETFIYVLNELMKFIYKLNPSVYNGESQPYVSTRDIYKLSSLFRPGTGTSQIINVIESLREMPTLVMGDVLWDGRLLSPPFDVINEDESQQMMRKPLRKSRTMAYYDYMGNERVKLGNLDPPIPPGPPFANILPMPTQDRLLVTALDSKLSHIRGSLERASEKETLLRKNLIPTSTKVPKRRPPKPKPKPKPNAPEKPRRQRRRQTPAPKTNNRPAWR